MAEAANRLNVKVAILDSADSPAGQVVSNNLHVTGSFKDEESILKLASVSSVLTVEIEHIDTKAMMKARDQHGIEVHPSPETVAIIQDKFAQKKFFQSHGIPLPAFYDLSEYADEVKGLTTLGESLGYPLMLKTKTLAYDGRGNRLVKSAAEIPEAIKSLGGGKSSGGPGLYVEGFVEFEREVAVMVARTVAGDISSYPCVDTIQKDNICHLVIAPAQIDGLVAKKAQDIAEAAVKCLQGAGIFGVEMFVLRNGDILLNEIAPRPHNSGHYTLEACLTSQFEQHIRAILGMPLGDPSLKVPAAAMINILGTGSGEKAHEETFRPCQVAMGIPGASVYLYGKAETRKGRKMGHINLTANSMPELLKNVDSILAAMPGGKQEDIKIQPAVGIIMGSDSDLPSMKPAAAILKEFGVPFEITIVSAHRTPHRMVEYAEAAHKRGLKAIIAAAGGAAHLPGMVAALTPLPVIGVPIALKYLDGVDSLHSIVQMPRGVPVATVAINNSTNAALLAIRILGSSTPSYLEKIIEHRKKSEKEVLDKVDRISPQVAMLHSVCWFDVHGKLESVPSGQYIPYVRLQIGDRLRGVDRVEFSCGIYANDPTLPEDQLSSSVSIYLHSILNSKERPAVNTWTHILLPTITMPSDGLFHKVSFWMQDHSNNWKFGNLVIDTFGLIPAHMATPIPSLSATTSAPATSTPTTSALANSPPSSSAPATSAPASTPVASSFAEYVFGSSASGTSGNGGWSFRF
ncbi:phosphoribosylaminoimidazole carboxylase ade2 [Phlyctochytrium planicorne]|nr:phosphoribosylaminoimidazole carboxylase ade2 [Phlyctochytrium planicorne]